MIKNVKHVELKLSIVFFRIYTNFKDDLIEYKCLSCNKSYQRKLDEKLKKHFSMHTNFLTMIRISLFYYEKVFIVMNIRTVQKNSMKRNYLEKKIFIVT